MRGVLAWSLAAVLAGVFWTFAGGPNPRHQDRVLAGGVRTRFHFPDHPGPYPAVLCLHSVFQDEETAEPMARTLARNGYLAVNLRLDDHRPDGRGKDFEGYLDDARVVLAELESLPEVRGVGLMGHSMGADLACQLARESKSVQAVVAVGFPVEAEPDAPPHLMLAVGAWDQLHSLQEMRECQGRAGAGCRLVALPRADHSMENFDPDLFRESVLWFDGVFQLGPREPTVPDPDPYLAQGVELLGTLGLGLVLLGWLKSRFPGNEEGSVFRSGGARVAAAAGFAGTVALLPFPGAAAGLFLATLSTGGLQHPPPRAAGLGLLYLGAGLAGVGASLLVNSLGGVWEMPWVLVRLPECLARALPLYLMRACSVLFQGGFLSPAALGLAAIELIAPGCLFRAAAGALRGLTERLRSFRLELRLGARPAHGLVLLVLVAALVPAWAKVIQAGYLVDGATLLRILAVFLKLLVLPLLVFGLAVRSKPFRALERNCSMPPETRSSYEQGNGATG